MVQEATSGQTQELRCMEIWGGAKAADQQVSTPGLDVWVYSRPHAGAAEGGDVHYVSLCGGGVITRLMVADVSGHGAAVADFGAMLRDLMRRNINTKSQTRLVRALNQQFSALSQMRRFATAVVATYLAPTGRFTICNAGHPRPFWYRAATSSWSVLTPETLGKQREAGNLPLGFDEDAPYEQFWIQLARGDYVVVYTDALTESASPTGELLREQGLLDLLEQIDETDPRALGHALLHELERHRAGAPADDDTTLMIVRQNGSPRRRLSVGEKLDVYAKVLGVRRV